MFTRSLVLSLVLLFSTGAFAHHSTTHFSREVSAMEGTLVELRWRNPHIYFLLETVEENGEKKLWEMEAGTIYMIGRAGVTEDMFAVGDTLRVAGNKSEVYDDKFWVENIVTATGNEVLVVANGTPYFTDEVLGGQTQWSNQAFINDGPKTEADGIFRVWSPTTRGVQSRLTGDPTNRVNNVATEKSIAAGVDWDPYAFDGACELPGMPRTTSSPHPYQFIKDGEDILILGEEFYITRRIHMNSDVEPETVPPSHQGYSVGHWQDENTLFIETTRINFPWLNLGGLGQSENSRVTEKYVYSEGEDRLDYEIITYDPEMLTTPYIIRGVWLDIGETINGYYDCIPTGVAATAP